MQQIFHSYAANFSSLEECILIHEKSVRNRKKNLPKNPLINAFVPQRRVTQKEQDERKV